MADLENQVCVQQYYFCVFLAEKGKSDIAGRGPDFKDKPKLAAECINQHI